MLANESNAELGGELGEVEVKNKYEHTTKESHSRRRKPELLTSKAANELVVFKAIHTR